MRVNSVEVNGNNQVIVNGTKLMWIDLADLLSYGNDNASYVDRFKELLKDRANGIKPNRELGLARVKEHNAKTGRFNGLNGKKNLGITRKKIAKHEDVYDLLKDSIDELAIGIYSKLRDKVEMELDDIKSELWIIVYECYDKYKNTDFALTHTNVKSFIYRAFRDSKRELYNIISKYADILLLDTKEVEFLLNNKYIDEDEIITFDNELAFINIASEKVADECMDYTLQMIQGMENAEFEASKYVLYNMLEELKPRDKEIIYLRFGLADGCPRTLEEVGVLYSICRDRARTIEARVLRRLRSKNIEKKLRDLL